MTKIDLNNNGLIEKLKKGLPFIALIFVVIFFQIISDGRLLTSRNLSSLTNEIFMILIGACGLAFLMSQDCIDFSIGGNLAVSCAIAAHAAVINPFLALPVAVIVGALIGWINGMFHAKFRIMSFILTLAMSFILRGLIFPLLDNGSISVPFSMLKWDSVMLRLLVMVVTFIVGYIVFEKSVLGKQCRAIGSNLETARQSGVNIDRIKIIGFMIAGGLAGFVAFFSLIRSATASTSTGAGFEVNALNALLIGGMPITGGYSAKFYSVIIGSLIVAVISSGMTLWGLSIMQQQAVRGLIFLFAISLTLDRRGMAVIK